MYYIPPKMDHIPSEAHQNDPWFVLRVNSSTCHVIFSRPVAGKERIARLIVRVEVYSEGLACERGNHSLVFGK